MLHGVLDLQIIIGLERNIARLGEMRDHSEDLGVRWEDNIKMNLKEVECESMVWIYLVLDRDQWRDFVKTAMKFMVP
jgi:hypothetical protein